MANDRIYLVCSVCKAQDMSHRTYAFHMAKYYPSTGYYVPKSACEDFGLRLEKFLDRHHLCSLEEDGRNFVLGYENDVVLTIEKGTP